MYSKAGIGYILVIAEATHQVDTGRKGVDGKPIIMDIGWNPLQYALNYAQVYQLPIAMGDRFIGQEPAGHPPYGPYRADPDSHISGDLYTVSGGIHTFHKVSDIEPVVQKGDKVYIKPRTLNNSANYMGTLKSQDGKSRHFIYRVPYENIFCRVDPQTGKIEMVGNWALVSPIYEDWDDILIKTYTPFRDKNGNRIAKPKDQWIQKKKFPEHDIQRGVLAHVARSWRGKPFDITPGSVVAFKAQVKPFIQTIEGQQYIVMYQDTILGQITSLQAKVGT